MGVHNTPARSQPQLTQERLGNNISLPRSLWSHVRNTQPPPSTFTNPLIPSQRPPPQNLVLRDPPRQPLPHRPTRHNPRLNRPTSPKRPLPLRPNLRPPPHALPPRHPTPPRIHPRLPPRHLPKEPQHKIPRRQSSNQRRQRLRTLLPRPPYRRIGMCVRTSSFRWVD